MSERMKVWVVLAPGGDTPGFGQVEIVFGGEHGAELADRWASMGDMEVAEAEVVTDWDDAPARVVPA